MLSFRTRVTSFRVALWLLLGAATLVFNPLSVLAGGPPFGIPSGVMPWEYYKYYKTYREPVRSGETPTHPPLTVSAPARKYTIQVASIPYKHTAEDPNAVILMAHVPEDAAVWLNEMPTKQRGLVRYFASPPVEAGYAYAYAVRVAWREDKEWVSQTVQVPVAPGEVRCFYIVHADQAKELAEVTANLEKLPPEDQKLALQQKTCAVQSDKPLGSMGVPVKLMIKGQPVLLCCEACSAKAQASPDQTLEQVRRNKAAPTRLPGH